MYFQFTSLFILAVFILNFKVFNFGYKSVKHVKTKLDQNSIAWAKQEFQDATSYLNSTIESPAEQNMLDNDRQLKKEILSYGLISIKEEKVEYVDGSLDTSFILFDASAVEENSLDKQKDDGLLPQIEQRGGFNRDSKRTAKRGSGDLHAKRGKQQTEYKKRNRGSLANPAPYASHQIQANDGSFVNAPNTTNLTSSDNKRTPPSDHLLYRLPPTNQEFTLGAAAEDSTRRQAPKEILVNLDVTPEEEEEFYDCQEGTSLPKSPIVEKIQTQNRDS